MSFFHRLFGRGEGGDARSAANTETVRKIVSRLESLPAERARFVAAFAYVLSRVAHADLQISKEETRVKQIASELGFSHSDYVEALAAWREHRSILRDRG